MNHPLNKSNKLKAIQRWFSWQVRSRLVRGPIVVSFVNGTKLLVKNGMTGATGNIYCGLHEFESMAFCLHLLKSGDLFCDIGANIGSYSILAASIGTHCLSFEPIPSTHQHLLGNIAINRFEELIDTRNLALGDQKGILYITKQLDTMNHVASSEERLHDSEQMIEVSVDCLDNILGNLKPTLIKVDAEGYEEKVLDGALRALSADSLLAAIIEINTSTIHQKMLDLNFSPFRYYPFEKRLERLSSANPDDANTIYLKNIDFVLKRIKSAKPFEILGQKIG